MNWIVGCSRFGRPPWCRARTNTAWMVRVSDDFSSSEKGRQIERYKNGDRHLEDSEPVPVFAIGLVGLRR